MNKLNNSGSFDAKMLNMVVLEVVEIMVQNVYQHLVDALVAYYVKILQFLAAVLDFVYMVNAGKNLVDALVV